MRALARAQVDLALGVYAAVRRDGDGNVALGPTSLAGALLMVRAGAAGRTAQELDDVLGLRGIPDPRAAAGALRSALARCGQADGVELSAAARVWVDRSFTPDGQFVTRLARDHGADLAAVDLQDDPEAARAAINGWVSEHTRGRVPELFPVGTPTGDSRLVLTDAVALEAEWETAFDAPLTRDAGFRLLDGSVVQVPVMHRDAGVEVARAADWTAVRLPYRGGELAMTVVVPADLAALEQRLTADLLGQVEAAVRPSGAALLLPRFTARRASGLAAVLAGLGLRTLFDPRAADLSGISRTAQLFVGAVRHEAVVTVDERGTRAAAATGVDVRRVSLTPPVVVDRPFLFVVRHRPTGAVLFLGRVTDPRRPGPR